MGGWVERGEELDMDGWLDGREGGYGRGEPGELDFLLGFVRNFIYAISKECYTVLELRAIESKAAWKREGVRKFIAEGNRTDKSRSLDDDNNNYDDIDIDIDLYRYDTSAKLNSAPPFDHTLLTPNTPHIVFRQTLLL